MSASAGASPSTSAGTGAAPARRFVVVSGYYPPIAGGTSTVMRQLLSAFEPDSYAVVAEHPETLGGMQGEAVPPGVAVRRAGVPGVFNRIPYLNRVVAPLRYRWMPFIRHQIRQAIREIGAERIVAVYPSWPFLIAAWQVHLETGIPLYTYYMDVTVDNPVMSPLYLRALQTWEATIVRGAHANLCLSDALAEDLQARYGPVRSAVITHAIDLQAPPDVDILARLPADVSDQHLIVHTGVVEYLQAEGLKRILSALRAHPELNARLVLSTPTSEIDVRDQGLDQPDVTVLRLERSEVRALQRAGSIAVAVLPFERQVTGLQDTSFPTKTVEYMHSGTPILAHTPENSFFARHVAHHGYAELVTEPDVEALARALKRLLTDETRRQELREAGHRTAQDVFALKSVASRFRTAVGLHPDTARPGFRT